MIRRNTAGDHQNRFITIIRIGAKFLHRLGATVCQNIRDRRLKPGAPLVVAHHSVPDGAGERDRWLARSAAFAVASGVPAAQASARLPAMRTRLPLLSPERDVGLLREAGFGDIELFYAGFTFRGWVATRS